MRKLVIVSFTFAALACLSAGCSDKKDAGTPTAAADEVVLSVPGMN
jgi:hypothetical protein